MIIKSIKINNFQLIKSIESTFDKINIVTGINLDNPNESGNGSGKSTLVLRAILFCLYGYCEEGLTLKDLIRFDEKECSVEVQCSVNNEHFRIIRKIPSELQIFLNDKEIVANTATIKQQFINEQLGDINFFRQYRVVDSRNGINVLDLGIVSLRKTMMGFIEGIFTEIRTRLLAQKVERERYSVDRRLYKFYLSNKRLSILENALISAKTEIDNEQKEYSEQQKIVNKISSEIQTLEKLISNRQCELTNAQKSGICPILKKKCTEITKTISSEQQQKINAEIEEWNNEKIRLKVLLGYEQEYLEVREYNNSVLAVKKHNAENYLMKLQAAFKFKDYKYSKTDIVIFDEAIKVMDIFSGIYIKEWLSSLSVIINNLLRAINISVEFTADKDFLKVYDNEQLLKYDQLSTGQRCFLGLIFKLAILLQQNKTGLLVMDDGLNNIDRINFSKLIDILKTLPFQSIAIYQNYDLSIDDVRHFVVIRDKGESKIQ